MGCLKLQSERDVSHEVTEEEGWFDAKLKVHFVYEESIFSTVKKGGFDINTLPL